MMFGLGTVICPVEMGFWPESETDTLFLEGERDRTPMVCPMVVVWPENWI